MTLSPEHTHQLTDQFIQALEVQIFNLELTLAANRTNPSASPAERAQLLDQIDQLNQAIANIQEQRFPRPNKQDPDDLHTVRLLERPPRDPWDEPLAPHS